jgi:hypothetical protein
LLSEHHPASTSRRRRKHRPTDLDETSLIAPDIQHLYTTL